MHTREWTVTIYLGEIDDDRTSARAVLHGEAGAERLTGAGVARRNPVDRPVPEIGDELAAGRALSDLAHRLLEAAAADLEAFVSTT